MLTKRLAAAAVILLAAGTVANAQFNFKNLKDAAQKVAGNNKPSSAASTTSATPAAQGKTYYVSASTGSARADGLSATSAMKDLQKAINTVRPVRQCHARPGQVHQHLRRLVYRLQRA